MADDSSAVFWNPAGLSLARQVELGGTKALLPEKDSFDAVTVAAPLASWGTLGLGLTRIGYALQEGRDSNRRPTGGFSASDTAASLAYGRRLYQGLHAGLTVKRVSSRIADDTEAAYGADAGLLWAPEPGSRLRLGAAARNLGKAPRLGQEDARLPAEAALGVSFRLLPGLLLAMDSSYDVNAARGSFAFGTEYRLVPMLSLRAGSRITRTSSALGPSRTKGFMGGVGLSWSRFSLDYALTPYGEMGNIQIFSLTARF